MYQLLLRLARNHLDHRNPGKEAELHDTSSPGEFTRCILDSLAEAYRRALADAVRLSGRTVDVVHVVGGGARNEMLCQLTADACGLSVVAGPVEATALGNMLVQARAHGTISGDLAALRGLLAGSQSLTTYRPR